MKFAFLFVLFIGSWSSAFNQITILNYNVSDLDNEQIFVQTNSTFLITGETLYFRIFCQQRKNNKPTMLSKVAYLELIDELGAAVFQTKIPLKNGSGHGDVFIPSTFSSGNYTLIAYTRWMRNFSTDSFSQNQITIVNPFRQPATTSSNSDKKVPQENAVTLSQPNDIQLDLSGKKFKAREKVSVTLTSEDMASVSISIRKKEKIIDDAGTIHKRSVVNLGAGRLPAHDSTLVSPVSSQQDSHSSSRANPYLPEIRGHLITGTLTAKQNGTSKRNILASIPGSDFVFHATATDQNGNFAMIVDRIPESSTMIFQVKDDEVNNYVLKIDDPFLGDYSGFKPAPLVIDTGLQTIVDERNIYTQIENAYFVSKKDSVPLAPSPSFFNLPDKVYNLDDFTRFPTMEDIFREYIPEVVVKRSRGTFSLQAVSPGVGDPPSGEPLMLIDGVPILNTNTFMAYDPLKIERIEIVKKKYFYGSLYVDGIVSLKTYKGLVEDLPSINSHRENLVKIQPSKFYFFPDYSAAKFELERVPDYRLQLYWNPNVIVTSDKATTIDFYTSDVTGDFEIIVEGFSTDGALVNTRGMISVLK
jgi:hypothetical protein